MKTTQRARRAGRPRLMWATLDSISGEYWGLVRRRSDCVKFWSNDRIIRVRVAEVKGKIK